MAQYNKDNLFVKVPVTNINNYSENIDLYGQIAFLDGSTNTNNDITYGKFSYLYAQGNSFGDGAFSNKTIITKNIMVSGGPLASLVGDKYKDGITAGTDLESLLIGLFSKVLFPTITKNVSEKAQFSVDTPNLIYKNNGNTVTSGNMYPVNTVLTLDKNSISEYNVTLPIRQITGMTYGFKYKGINNTWIDSNETSYSVSWENNSVSDVSYNFDATYTGFGDSSYVSIEQEDSIAYISSYLKLGFGENKITVTAYAEASNFTAKCPEIPEIIMYANDGSTGNTEFKDEDGKLGKIKKISSASETVTLKPGKTTPRLDTTSTSSFYGVYPFKFNGIKRNYNNLGADNETHNGGTTYEFTPSGEYNTTNSVDLCINYGDSTIDNKDEEAKKYKFYIPKDYTVSNFVAYANDPDKPNAWEGTTTISYTITEDSDLINNRYEFNVTGAEAKYCGIRIKFNWKF